MTSMCHICGIPSDAGVFDESNIIDLDQPVAALGPGQELVLARYQLHRNYCGILLHFAQFTDQHAADPRQVQTPGYQWLIRSGGQPLDPYLQFDHIKNPWGSDGLPINLRLGEGAVIELVIRNVNAQRDQQLGLVGGRIMGRFWYNIVYGGTPHQL